MIVSKTNVSFLSGPDIIAGALFIPKAVTPLPALIIIHGEDDKVDLPETARLLFAALSCVKRLCIIPGNGHLGHMDRNKDVVMELTSD